ncbi:MAG TPA: caspase family protein [Polyangiaceae bacterium]|nr:caspase family protein [Polyangiaceae bacterium]
MTEPRAHPRAISNDIRARRLKALFVVLLSLLFHASPARAATQVHALVIGNNGAFVSTSAAPAAKLLPLHYADDDAAAFFELIREIAYSAELLTVMDTETQALYPTFVASAQVPTLEAVRGAVGRIAKRIGEQRAAGHRNVVFVFFSGHGAVDYEGKPALALADAGLGHDFLYREILEKLPADEVHLLIDACHAEAVVRPRDLEGDVVSVSPAQASAFLVQSTLARFPNVGAIVAATTNTKAHEWDVIRHGIFTHELLSALRGAADVNRDRRIEYSEVYAFMASANREIGDARARLAIVAKPPEINRRAALLTLQDFPRTRLAWLSGVSGQRGIIEVDDFRGRRLATLHGDRDFVADVLLPAGSTLYVRGGQQETSFSPHAGDVVAFESLKFVDVGVRERGALDAALRNGLFAATYGRRYYEGIVDQTPGFLPVDFPKTDYASTPQYFAESGATSSGPRLVLGGGISSGIAENLSTTQGLNFGMRPNAGSGLSLSLEALRAADGPLVEWHFAANAGWLWSLGSGPFRGWLGGMVGAGLLSQAVEGQPQRSSAFVDAGPVLGLTADVAGHFGLWTELELAGVLLRQDDQVALSFMPSAWLGGSWRL